MRRIFPALIVMLVGTYSLGWFVLMADEFKQLNLHLIAGSAFVSNLALLREAGYFDSSADLKPLLHLWSLGVEEQFYIIWPLLLWGAWKLRLKPLLFTLFVFAVSFFCCAHVSRSNSAKAFFLPQFRFWEILSGSLLAWWSGPWSSRFPKISAQQIGAMREVSCTLALGLLVVGLEMAGTHRAAFPGYWALLPVTAAFLIIFSGPNAWLNRIVLSHPVAVNIGLMSFPLYLWHWPLLSFLRIVESREAPAHERLVAVVLALFLANITYRFVERPLRFGKRFVGTTVGLTIAMLAVVGAGFFTYKKNGFGFRDRDREAFVEYFENSKPEWRFLVEHHILEAFKEECNSYDLEAHRNGHSTEIPRPIPASCTQWDSSKPKGKSLFLVEI